MSENFLQLFELVPITKTLLRFCSHDIGTCVSRYLCQCQDNYYQHVLINGKLEGKGKNDPSTYRNDQIHGKHSYTYEIKSGEEILFRGILKNNILHGKLTLTNTVSNAVICPTKHKFLSCRDNHLNLDFYTYFPNFPDSEKHQYIELPKNCNRIVCQLRNGKLISVYAGVKNPIVRCCTTYDNEPEHCQAVYYTSA